MGYEDRTERYRIDGGTGRRQPRETALVTGGARRIGRAIAVGLARAGFRVAIHCNTSRAEAQRVVAEIAAAGGEAAIVRGDLADAAAVAELIPQAEAALGPVSLVVNNASMFVGDTVDDLDPDLFARQMAVNLAAPCLLASQLAARLPDGWSGNVVNMIDQRVWRLTPNFFSYTLAKSALWTATRTMAQGLAPRIRVNGIGPGPTLANERQSPEDFRRQSEAVLLGAGPGTDEIVAAVLFLVTTPSITGQMLALDGGQHLAWQTPDVVGIVE
ncbi:SDR family oxidoreductase [Methylobrevis pamukkalensis]|uniref:Diacetyl reductase [(S)-acetoin forming] n=1 Tax=Methylobrevis pamukkalensis TaxID=1439726 RepID=A0A1E3H7J0_9HYPH|nr:SDR family oxidoreductase [Methylobrevis pamukkalensis]ODN71471.1 Diacetyl reductase [(S)-acetoin forming] [Methylobrevis pamukkalensis]